MGRQAGPGNRKGAGRIGIIAGDARALAPAQNSGHLRPKGYRQAHWQQ